MHTLSIGKVEGLTDVEQAKLNELVDVFNYHISNNETKLKYYEGDISLSDVNLGIALPDNINKLEIGCDWGNKTVDVLASRSMFDGFVSANGVEAKEVQTIMDNNHMISEYQKAVKDQLLFGCTFATLSADDKKRCNIQFHSPMSAAALWNGEKRRIDYGLAIIDSVVDESKENMWFPKTINYHTDEYIIILERLRNGWKATRHPHKMGEAMMVPFVWNATNKKPFGRSRIKKTVRRMIQGYVRTVANATIGLEFATSPQKYLLGVTDEQYDALINEKFKQYIGSILMTTTNPETGEKPSFGQLPQGSIQQHVEMLRMLSTQFSAATGLSVTDTGVVNDANPTSSDAILAQSQTLVSMAEQLNNTNGEALKTVAKMALAIAKGVSLDSLEDEDRDVAPHFKNPAMPSIAMMADAAIKIASAREGFAQTDVYLEMNGFSQADIRRIKAQEARARGEALLKEEFNADFDESVAGVYTKNVSNQREGGGPDAGMDR